MKSLTRVKAIGTDGERNIIEAAQQQFQEALLLRCFHHLQTNIERHLHLKQISSATTRLFIQDIFGWTDIEVIHREGLVDCKDADEFYDLLSDLKDTWLQRESCSSSSETFYDWFMKYKAEVFGTSTLQPLHEAAGLGKPPIGYFTNPNESVNSALKKKTNYKKQELPVFINLMRNFVIQQQEEVEKAVTGGGKYTLDTPYKGYEVTDGIVGLGQ